MTNLFLHVFMGTSLLNWAIPLNKDTPPIDDNLICPGGVAADFCPRVVLLIANVCPRALYR